MPDENQSIQVSLLHRVGRKTDLVSQKIGKESVGLEDHQFSVIVTLYPTNNFFTILAPQDQEIGEFQTLANVLSGPVLLFYEKKWFIIRGAARGVVDKTLVCTTLENLSWV